MVKKIAYISFFAMVITGCSENNNSNGTRKLLIEQLNNSHSKEEWFVPSNMAIYGITSEQAKWKDSVGNHSIGEIVSHLFFWNERNLIAFKGDLLSDFDNNNEATFNNEADWNDLVKKLDSVQTEWETIVKTTPEDSLVEWSVEIANMATHTAYHTGQIMYIRKQKGWWNE